MNKIVEAAILIARHWHITVADQKRKYSGLPYIVHTQSVAKIVLEAGGDAVQVAVAHLHDTLEDTPLTKEGLAAELLARHVPVKETNEIVEGVIALTEVFTSKAYPKVNRAQRKTLEAQRLGGIDPLWKTVKLADLIDNTSDIVANDPSFAKVYLKEKKQLLPFLVGGDSALWERANNQVSSIS